MLGDIVELTVVVRDLDAAVCALWATAR